MTFSEFCGIGQPSWFSCSSQAQYLKGVFKSAGITRDYSDDYLKAVYNGTSKSLNANMKKHFPKPIDELKIADYYESHIKTEYVSALCDAFAVPTSLERSRKFLSIAMARQVAAFISSKEDNIDCVVADAYEKAVVNEAAAHYEIPKRLYEGDDLWVEQHSKCHAVGCYQKFTHQWSIQNRGRCLWSGRKLVCVNQGEIKPLIKSLTIIIPEIKPLEHIKIATEVDSRGIEGTYNCVWEMQDASGNNCFPNSRFVFDFTVAVTFEI